MLQVISHNTKLTVVVIVNDDDDGGGGDDVADDDDDGDGLLHHHHHHHHMTWRISNSANNAGTGRKARLEGLVQSVRHRW